MLNPRMLNRKPDLAIAVFSALMLVAASGCEKKPFVVEVRHGFMGYVHVACGSTVGLPQEPIQVNSFGGGAAKSCPGEDAAVRVLRDGQTATTMAVHWERAGDGSPVGLSFDVK